MFLVNTEKKETQAIEQVKTIYGTFGKKLFFFFYFHSLKHVLFFQDGRTNVARTAATNAQNHIIDRTQVAILFSYSRYGG